MNVNTTTPIPLKRDCFPSVVLAVVPAVTMDEASSVVGRCVHIHTGNLSVRSYRMRWASAGSVYQEQVGEPSSPKMDTHNMR